MELCWPVTTLPEGIFHLSIFLLKNTHVYCYHTAVLTDDAPVAFVFREALLYITCDVSRCHSSAPMQGPLQGDVCRNRLTPGMSRSCRRTETWSGDRADTRLPPWWDETEG